MGRKRSPQREEFLAYLLVGAVQHGGYGFSRQIEGHFPADRFGEWFAVIADRYLDPGDEGYGGTWRVDLDTMAKGLGVIRDAVLGEVEYDGMVRHNRETGKRLRFDDPMRGDLLLADRTNGEDGDYDVIGAMAVLECALFGSVVFA